MVKVEARKPEVAGAATEVRHLGLELGQSGEVARSVAVLFFSV